MAVCITGDLTTTGSFPEFAEAEHFIRNLSATPIFSKQRPFSSIFFNVPGNHDVIYDKATVPERLATFAQFLSGLTKTYIDPAKPWDWPLLYDCTGDLGLIVACINSSIYVEKGKPDQDRGHVDVTQLARIKRELEAIEPERLHNSIRVALIHHHPVLIPALAEPGRGYDAVHNSGKLLAILRKFGFHMVLHGHKHDPYVFTEDSRSAFRTTHHNPILIAAGGSVGSTDLPKNRWNSYNRISVKWHPAAGQARILIETVGLSVTDQDANELLPSEWAWRVLRREDLHFLRGECVPTVASGVQRVRVAPNEVSALDKRLAEYSRLRGNMLCVDVRPSLMPDQGYEAVVWVTAHKRKYEDAPIQVEWSAGRHFEFKTVVTNAVDNRFAAVFNYWGPMLVQATLSFADGGRENGFIYARIPEDCSSD